MRKRICIESVALVLLTGCGVFGSTEDEHAPSPEPEVPVAAPNRPAPSPPPLDGTAKQSDLDEKLGVFVSTTGSVDAEGTRGRPVSTIAKGIAMAKATGKRVYVCAGTYREAIVVEDGIPMVGGLDCSTPEWAIGNGRSRVESPTIPALSATKITAPTRIERFDVIAPDAVEPSASSIGFVALDAPALTIAKSRIEAGNAMKGTDGAAAIQLTQGGNVDGGNGMPSTSYCVPGGLCGQVKVPRPGAAGGTSRCLGAPGHDGAPGGAGGSGGLWIYSEVNFTYAWRIYGDVNANAPKGGAAGSGAPTNGTDGASASTWGSFGLDGFVPASGTKGTDGAPGRGGAGGGGQGPTSPPGAGNENLVYHGIAGAGGGAGGCPGLAGEPGTGGGASIGARLTKSPVTFEEVEIVAKNGGDGGAGAFPSSPTPGGSAGSAILGGAYSPASDGTPGGQGGVSGSGAGGPTVGIVHTGGAPKLVATTTKLGKPGAGVAEKSAGGKTIPASASGLAQELLGWESLP